jgi:hypothetical protein
MLRAVSPGVKSRLDGLGGCVQVRSGAVVWGKPIEGLDTLDAITI